MISSAFSELLFELAGKISRSMCFSLLLVPSLVSGNFQFPESLDINVSGFEVSETNRHLPLILGANNDQTKASKKPPSGTNTNNQLKTKEQQKTDPHPVK